MKIAVYDADQACRDAFETLRPDHEVVYIEESISDGNIAAHADAEVVSLFVASRLTKEYMDQFPHLRLVVARSTGVDHIDVAHAKERSIAVVNVPKYGARTVAEYAFALILALSRRVIDSHHRVHDEDEFYTKGLEGFDIGGKTLGVVGTGAIGRNVVRIAQGFGMQVIMNDKFPDHSLENESTRYASLDDLLAGADIVTLHTPYLPENHHLINAQSIARMRRGAYLINTARGELVDTQALVDALRSGALGGAGLDVLEGERSLKDEYELLAHETTPEDLRAVIRDRVLIEMPNVLVTPHVAFFSREAYHEILSISVNGIRQFAARAPINLVQ